MNRNKRLFQTLELIFILFLLSLLVNVAIEVESNSNSSGSLTGWVDADFGDNGFAIYGFSGYYPSNWSSTSPVELKYECGLHDETISINITFFLSYKVEFYTTNEEMIYNGEKIIVNTINSGYEFLDSFIQHVSWNLSAEKIGIPSGITCFGQLYLYGSLSLGDITYYNTSNRALIKYNNPSSSFEASGLRIEPTVLSLGVLILIIKVLSHRKQSF